MAEKIDKEAFLTDPKYAGDRELLEGVMDQWLEKKAAQAKETDQKTGGTGGLSYLAGLLGFQQEEK